MANLDYHGLSLYDSLLDIDKAKAASLAPEFDSTADYAAGDYVMRTGVLYQFTAAHSAGAWTGDDAETVQLAPAVGALQDLKDWMLGLYPQREIDNVAIATFSDGADEIPVKKLIAKIAPVQDLHGYANPWPGGAGSNLFDPQYFIDAGFTIENGYYKGTASQAGTALSAFNSAFTFEADTSYAISYVCYSAEGVSFRLQFEYTDSSKSSASPFSTTSPQTASVISSNGKTVASIGRDYSSSGTIYIKDILLVEAATLPTYSPYANICPISGFTGANAIRTGKNLLDPDMLYGYYDADNSGAFVSSQNWRASQKIKCKPLTNYFMSGTSYSGGGYSGKALFWDASGHYLGYQGTTQPIATPAGAAYLAVYTGHATVTNKMQLEEGSSASSYVPFSGQTVEVTFPGAAGTVYGGTLDVTSGKLTVDRAITNFPTAGWTSQDTLTNTMRYSFSLVSMLNVGSNNVGDVVCSEYPTIADASDAIHIMHRATSIHAFVSKADYPNVNAWMSYLSGLAETPQVVYPLATPVEYTLSPEQLTTILGLNNIWADTGDIAELIYRASLQSQLDAISTQLAETVPGMIAGVEDDFVATRNYTAGDYFVVNQVLYKATANIANGAALTPNVNCSETTVGAELVTIINS